ncbi:UNKNOWN [Stylonychia lemnae]|uniref:DUF4604 domain-containing protein n=1 Tax=Stylonychia lemnae TaxID=5949 RepID=A0A078AJ92_STYLE|nr:UNKNOWN [Stylonychia lemnae]|eukprot:CDW82370.1 UNKNOWN [Stylonychia lemnae]
MSHKQGYTFVKQVPDFIQKMGLGNKELQDYKEKTEHKLEDKLPQNPATDEDKKKQAEKEEYDFENAQIEDLGNFISAEGDPEANQDKLMTMLKKRIAKLDEELEKTTGADNKLDISNKEVCDDNKQVEVEGEEEKEGSKKAQFVRRRDRKTIAKSEKADASNKQIENSKNKDKKILTSKSSKVVLSFEEDDI